MNSAHLNEHDANQGAQSSGEFLGMTGNSGWWLLGSAGAAVMMVVFLWGFLGMSLLLCLFVGIVLCALSLLYVFALKNNKPAHYDSDFFEAVFAETGIADYKFGPRPRRPKSPFKECEDAGNAPDDEVAPRRKKDEKSPALKRTHQHATERARATASSAPASEAKQAKKTPPPKPAEPVTDATIEALHEELEQTREMLDEALVERAED